MSLWGNNDNKLSDGTVTVNHANLTVIGSGTTFGSVGCGATGDIIRFGSPLGGPSGYFGEATIVAIGGTQSIVIDSIAGMTPKDITGVNYQITQSPKSTVTDAAFNKFSRGDAQKGDLKLATTINGNVAIGGTEITTTAATTGAGIAVGDLVVIEHGTVIPRRQFGEVFAVATNKVTLSNGLPSTHSAYKTDGAAYTTSVSVVNVQEAPARAILDGGAAGAHLADIQAGDTFTIGTNSIGIGTVTAAVIGGKDTRILTLDSNLTQAIAENALGSTVIIKRGAITGSVIEVFGAEVSTDETQTVGVATAGAQSSNQTAFETGAGWVGVTTYTDNEGNMRVKKEILVAMSGIQTGNTPIYDGNPFA